VQNQVLFMDRLPLPFDETSPFQHVGERRTLNEDGLGISEWAIDYDELKVFVNSLSAKEGTENQR
jgi:hypothetical protein